MTRTRMADRGRICDSVQHNHPSGRHDQQGRGDAHWPPFTATIAGGHVMHRRHLETGADRAALLLMSLLAAMVLGGCAAPVSGQASRAPTVDLTPRQMRELADDVLAAHADLRAVTKTVTSREPYTVDKFTAVERAVDGSVHRLVTFEPSTAATLGIDEIRCLGAENFATPIPANLATEGPTGQYGVKTVAEPEDDAAELAFMVAYFCDWGWPTTLDWDLEYLLAARSIVDLGTMVEDGVPLRHLVVEVPLRLTPSGR